MKASNCACQGLYMARLTQACGAADILFVLNLIALLKNYDRHYKKNVHLFAYTCIHVLNFNRNTNTIFCKSKHCINT